jgi:hypothetical protein
MDGEYSTITPPEQNWHTYGLDWQPGLIKIFVDNNLVKSFVTTHPLLITS